MKYLNKFIKKYVKEYVKSLIELLKEPSWNFLKILRICKAIDEATSRSINGKCLMESLDKFLQEPELELLKQSLWKLPKESLE